MKKLLILLSLGFCAHSTWACGTGPTSVEWNGWALKSNEMRWVGVTHNGMPLYNLADGDAKTAWVWSGLGGRTQKIRNAPKTLLFVPDKPLFVDEVRILSGYNKTVALWKRNNRIKALRITRDGDDGATWGSPQTPIKAVTLKDVRSWHRISIPRQKIKSIGLNILSEYSGTDNDLCISEVEFYNQGHKINFHLPHVIAISDGSQDSVSDEDWVAIRKQPERKSPLADGLVDRVSKRVLSELNNEEEPLFSPDGSLVCAISVDANERWILARIFNASSSRQIWRRRFELSKSPGWPSLSWQGRRRLKIKWGTQKQQSHSAQFVQF